MKRISKLNLKEIQSLVDEADAAATILGKAISDFNEAVEHQKGAVAAALERYNETVQSINETYQDLAGAALDYISDRSDKWVEGEAGQTYAEWQSALDGFAIDEAELELPEELNLPDSVPDFSNLDLPPEAPGE